jgi:uncharacterized membrane protein (UPF0127 family)
MPVRSVLIPSAAAKMAVDRLGIKPAGGGELRVFKIEIAKSPQEQAVGLMFRTELADDSGMLFHNKAEREITMWMRNTYIPLDMLFIRANGKIHHIVANTEPHSENIISSNGQVAAVLEIPGGVARRLGITVGDVVHHPLFGTSPPP